MGLSVLLTQWTEAVCGFERFAARSAGGRITKSRSWSPARAATSATGALVKGRGSSNRRRLGERAHAHGRLNLRAARGIRRGPSRRPERLEARFELARSPVAP